jgi:OOP family OmpA-OmpF porin
MNFELRFRRFACAVLLLAAAGAASAQSADRERGFYVGALAGVADYPARPKLIVGNFTLKSTDTREEDMSWGFTAGYRFNRHVALEAGYIDLGEATAKMIDSAGSDLRGDLRFAARGETLALVAFYPFGQQWEWFVKAGLLFQDVDFRLSGTQGGVPYRLSSSTNGGVKLYSEGGISYRFDTHWKASFGLSHYPHVGEKERTGRADILNGFLGISYHF